MEITKFEIRPEGVYVQWGTGFGNWVVHKKMDLMSDEEESFFVTWRMNFTDTDLNNIGFYYVEKANGIGYDEIGNGFGIAVENCGIGFSKIGINFKVSADNH